MITNISIIVCHWHGFDCRYYDHKSFRGMVLSLLYHRENYFFKGPESILLRHVNYPLNHYKPLTEPALTLTNFHES